MRQYHEKCATPNDFREWRPDRKHTLTHKKHHTYQTHTHIGTAVLFVMSTKNIFEQTYFHYPQSIVNWSTAFNFAVITPAAMSSSNLPDCVRTAVTPPSN